MTHELDEALARASGERASCLLLDSGVHLENSFLCYAGQSHTEIDLSGCKIHDLSGPL
jgi:hypothetical protein